MDAQTHPQSAYMGEQTQGSCYRRLSEDLRKLGVPTFYL
jgi:hypothetical protein